MGDMGKGETVECVDARGVHPTLGLMEGALYVIRGHQPGVEPGSPCLYCTRGDHLYLQVGMLHDGWCPKRFRPIRPEPGVTAETTAAAKTKEKVYLYD